MVYPHVRFAPQPKRQVNTVHGNVACQPAGVYLLTGCEVKPAGSLTRGKLYFPVFAHLKTLTNVAARCEGRLLKFWLVIRSLVSSMFEYWIVDVRFSGLSTAEKVKSYQSMAEHRIFHSGPPGSVLVSVTFELTAGSEFSNRSALQLVVSWSKDLTRIFTFLLFNWDWNDCDSFLSVQKTNI